MVGSSVCAQCVYNYCQVHNLFSIARNSIAFPRAIRMQIPDSGAKPITASPRWYSGSTDTVGSGKRGFGSREMRLVWIFFCDVFDSRGEKTRGRE